LTSIVPPEYIPADKEEQTLRVNQPPALVLAKDEREISFIEIDSAASMIAEWVIESPASEILGRFDRTWKNSSNTQHPDKGFCL
jgi:hypothetical protein